MIKEKKKDKRYIDYLLQEKALKEKEQKDPMLKAERLETGKKLLMN